MATSRKETPSAPHPQPQQPAQTTREEVLESDQEAASPLTFGATVSLGGRGKHTFHGFARKKNGEFDKSKALIVREGKEYREIEEVDADSLKVKLPEPVTTEETESEK